MAALTAVIQDALYRSSQVTELQHLAPCFPDETDGRLQKLLSQVGPHASDPTRARRAPPTRTPLLPQLLLARLPLWRKASIGQTVSLPRLVDVDWRVDLKTASDAVSNMNVPSTVVALRVEEQPQHRDEVPGVRHVKFELSRGAIPPSAPTTGPRSCTVAHPFTPPPLLSPGRGAPHHARRPRTHQGRAFFHAGRAIVGWRRAACARVPRPRMQSHAHDPGTRCATSGNGAFVLVGHNISPPATATTVVGAGSSPGVSQALQVGHGAVHGFVMHPSRRLRSLGRGCLG